MKIPDDIFKHELLQYLTVDDIVELDNACTNHIYRPELMDKISGVILTAEDKDNLRPSHLLVLRWLGTRRIYCASMQLFINKVSGLALCKIIYVDQLKYTQHILVRGSCTDDTMEFIISRCPFLISISLIALNGCMVSDDSLQFIATHCTGLQQLFLDINPASVRIKDAGLILISQRCTNLISLKLNCCSLITDSSIISISNHCPNLTYLEIVSCHRITAASIISISIHCIGLQSLVLYGFMITDACILSISTHCTGLQLLILDEIACRISDASIISISTHCTGLQSLSLFGCRITDASIISISTHCTGLQLLTLKDIGFRITDVSIISISTHCTGLKSLKLDYCFLISDASIIHISENCTGLTKLSVAYTDITDASLIAIAKNCTGLQSLNTLGCDRLHSDMHCRYDRSISDIRSFLHSIKPPPSSFLAGCTMH
jgi:hypothetical protein